MASLKHGAGATISAKSTLMLTIEEAFKAEWSLRQPDIPLKEDTNREIMFAAIAQGILRYLEDHEKDIYTDATDTITTRTWLEFSVE
jgi:hypothetical protein